VSVAAAPAIGDRSLSAIFPFDLSPAAV